MMIDLKKIMKERFISQDPDIDPYILSVKMDAVMETTFEIEKEGKLELLFEYLDDKEFVFIKEYLRRLPKDEIFNLFLEEPLLPYVNELFGNIVTEKTLNNYYDENELLVHIGSYFTEKLKYKNPPQKRGKGLTEC